MKGISLPIRTMIAVIIGIIMLVMLINVFMLGVQLSPLEAQRIFSEGCARYCGEITETSSSTGQPVGIAAIDKAHALEGTTFVRACNTLYPDTRGYTYLCWLKSCCSFDLPKP